MLARGRMARGFTIVDGRGGRGQERDLGCARVAEWPTESPSVTVKMDEGEDKTRTGHEETGVMLV